MPRAFRRNGRLLITRSRLACRKTSFGWVRGGRILADRVEFNLSVFQRRVKEQYNFVSASGPSATGGRPFSFEIRHKQAAHFRTCRDS